MECTSITIHRALFQLSPPQRLLCVEERLGEREKQKVRGAQWEGEREKKGPRLFPFPIVPLALSIFRLLLLLLGYPKEASTEKRGFICTLSIHHDDHDSWTPKMVDQGVTKMSLPRPRPLPPHLWSLAFKVVYGRFSTWAGFPSLESTEKRKTFQKL